MGWFRGLLIAVLVLLGATASAQQAPPAPADQAPPASVQQLLDLLRNPEVQAWLAQRQAQAPAAAAPAPAEQDAIDEMRAQTRGKLQWYAATARDLPGILAAVGARIGEALAELGLIGLVLAVGGFAGIGILVEWLFRRLTASIRHRLIHAPGAGIGEHLAVFAARLVFAVGNVVAFAVGSLGIFLIFTWPHGFQHLVLALLAIVLVARLARAVLRLGLAPGRPDLRLVAVEERVIPVIMRWLIAIPTVMIGGVFLARLMRRLDAPEDAALLIRELTSFLVLALVVAFTWRRRAWTDQPGLKDDLARWLVTVAMAAAAVLVALGAARAAVTVFVLALLPWGLRQIREAARSVASPDSIEGKDRPLAMLVERTAQALVILGALAFLADRWDVDSMRAMMAAGDPGAMALRAVLRIVLTLIVVDLLWHLGRAVIDHQLSRSTATMSATDAAHQSRLRTLLPLFRNAYFVTLATVAVLVVLSSLGIDIGPLLAGAGVVGLAIGFGAQTLVKDIVSGVFFLLEDAFRVGEYVEIGTLKGTVEAISIRSLKLRHQRGALQTVPFGEARAMTNLSRDWVVMKLEFRVPFETDVDQVKKIVKKIGAEIAADPTLGPHLLDPPKSQGVRRIEEFNMVVGIKFMARPGEQFMIRRMLYQRILEEFDAAGIHLARRDVVVRSHDGGEVDPAVAAAAIAATGGGPPQG
ncbi:mechanosensitive ion channel family protein [Inquilinus limosus]|uniref:mechanosensitive ion channel family protein n=1 Tax=Inquilinus limosus TaxID=171674 RepID=UPI0003FF3C2E|nr:mechanosensitive ion channel domain-containing protein [Inquilinus limosus]